MDQDKALHYRLMASILYPQDSAKPTRTYKAAPKNISTRKNKKYRTSIKTVLTHKDPHAVTDIALEVFSCC